jgi:hypothetical protein
LTVYRLERQIRALDAKLPDVTAARMLLKMSTMVSRLDWNNATGCWPLEGGTYTAP